MKKILILNGSINAENGNTNKLIKLVENYLEKKSLQFEVVHLQNANQEILEKIKKADGYIFTTGTYWDSWGSPMQKLLEEMTQLEAEPEILFKPACVIVTMHAFGGKSILSRLQGVLNTMGFQIPPMCGLVYSLATHEALEKSEEFALDFWSLEDLEIILHNLITATKKEYQYKAWPVDKKDPKRIWLKEV